MATLLIGVSPTDALTFVPATLLLGAIWAMGQLCAGAARHARGPYDHPEIRLVRDASARQSVLYHLAQK